MGCLNAAVDLTKAPPKVARTAERVLARLQAGTPYWQLGGKRLRFEDRALISIPVGRRYRLLCQAGAGGLHPFSLLTHESYNAAHNRRGK